MQATTTGTSTFNLTLGSGARELLKWIALLAMTGDHVAKVVFGGYVPVVS
ncbi:conjugal transfer protein, partial [Salmonella sp. 3DZ2-4SM]